MDHRDIAAAPIRRASPDNQCIIEELQRGDERAFMALINQHYTAMIRIAMTYVANRAVAEEVVQETWLGVLQGLDGFEARSSLKTWIFRILVNCAQTRKLRERRSVPFSALVDGGAEPTVDPERFFSDDHHRAAHHWSSPPRSWGDDPEATFLSGEAHGYIRRVIEALPPLQRAVITLRDIEGWATGEISALLGISEVNQRVLLHRARSRVRNALEQYIVKE